MKDEETPLLLSHHDVSDANSETRTSARCCTLAGRRKRRDRERYYQHLHELQEGYIEDDVSIVRNAEKRSDDDLNTTHGDNILARIVLVTNVGLLVGKAVATYSTSGSSLSIISTLLDSIVDITSGLVMWTATYAILHTDMHVYPHGRENLESVGVIFIGIAMGMANAFIVLQSVEAVVENKPAPDLTIASLSILGATILIKAILYALCMFRGTHVLSIDQRNDVLTNLVAVAGALTSNLYHPFLDPLAASLISGYIAVSWFRVVLGEMPRLSGVASTDVIYSRVARVCITTSSLVRCLDTLLVYHTGQKVRVEVHAVLPGDTPARKVTDEVLVPMRRRLEALPFVDRAFVHADYECDGYD